MERRRNKSSKENVNLPANTETSGENRNVDPVREKLKEWQVCRGRATEKPLPWQKNVTNVKKKEVEENHKPRKALKTINNNSEHLARTEKAGDRRKLFEKWLEEKKGLKPQQNKQTNVQPGLKCSVEKIIKSTIPSAKCIKLIEKPYVNFIEVNKKRLSEMSQRAKRRMTATNIRLKSNLSSLDKTKCRSSMQAVEYYCYKRSSKTSSRPVNRTNEAPPELPSFVAEKNDDEIRESKFTVELNEKTEQTDSNVCKILSPRVKFVISPIHHLPHLNIYTVTPVRRSLRISSTPAKSSQRQRRVVDSISNVPQDILPNLVYKENPALCLNFTNDA